MKKNLLFFISFTFGCINAQTELVFVFFKDKPNKALFFANPLSELTQKSLDRRIQLGISLNDQDAPIDQNYIQNIKNLGFSVSDQSKWLNGVAVNATATQISLLQSQPFVQNVESFVKNTSGGKNKSAYKFEKFNQEFDNKINFNYGTSEEQTNQINLKTLHQQGFTGNGIAIAVFDTGFPTVDTGNAYARLRNLGKIKGGYNYISKNNDLYNLSFNTHGSICMGAIGGYIEGQFVGSAPDADFYLYVTESGPLEIPEEELYWIQAAEDADRKGVDVISSSLGYGDFFDDSRYNYTYSDMTGTKSFVSRGAQIATEKGIIVMVAAGNEGNKEWHHILTPADNEKVFSLGAVTNSGESSTFSSFGPNYLGLIKPDASARGTSTATVFNNSITSASGTSLSTPVAAGGVASLLQALPKNLSRETIKNLLRQKSSLYPNFHGQKGYGILNFGDVYTQFLSTSQTMISKKFLIYPNPNKGEFILESNNSGIFKIFDFSGRMIHSANFKNGKNTIQIKKNSGVYIMSYEVDGKIYSEKLIIE